MPSVRGVVLIIATSFLPPFAPLPGQEAIGLTRGVRVRITADGLGIRQQVGTLVQPCGDTLVISGSSASSTLGVACVALTAVDISSGVRSKWAEGLGLGLLVGAATGAIVGTGCCTFGDVAVNGGPLITGLGAAGGALVGMIIGSTVHREGWRRVPLDRIRVGFTPPFSGQLGLTVALVL